MPQTDAVAEGKLLIEFMAKYLNVTKLTSGPMPEDPMLRLIRTKLKAGMELREALSSVVGEIEDCAKAMLDSLDYAPNAIMNTVLLSRLKVRGIDTDNKDLMNAALQYLVKHRKMEVINGWFVKLKPPIRITQDDLDWLTGRGRFAQ